MAYSTPYYDYIRNRSGSQFLSDTGVNTQPSMSIPKPNESSYPSSSRGRGRFGYDAIIGAIGQGVSSYAQGAADTYDFSVDPNAGYKGSFQGLSSGGAVGAIVGGIAGQMGTFSQVNKNLKNLDTGVNLSGQSATGQPIYTGAGYLDAGAKMNALNEGEDSTKMFWNGGKSYDPATIGFNKIFGTGDRIRRKRRELMRNRQAAQTEFNKGASSFEAQQQALDDYFKRLDMSSQLYNLY